MKFGLLFAHQVPPESGIASQETYRDMLRCLPRAEELGYVSAFQCSHHVQKDGFCPRPAGGDGGRRGGDRAHADRHRGAAGAALRAAQSLPRTSRSSTTSRAGASSSAWRRGDVTQEFAAHGVPREERVGRFEEALDLMTQAWSGEPFSFEGRYYRGAGGAGDSPAGCSVRTPPIWYGVSAAWLIAQGGGAALRADHVAAPWAGRA